MKLKGERGFEKKEMREMIKIILKKKKNEYEYLNKMKSRIDFLKK